MGQSRSLCRQRAYARPRHSSALHVLGGASLQTASLLGVTEWTRSEPSAVAAGILDRDGASRANDDGYVEGVEKALGL